MKSYFLTPGMPDFFLQLLRGRLGNFHEREFQAPHHFHQQVFVRLGQVAFGFLPQHIDHIDDFARALEIEKSLPRARIGHAAKHRRGVARQKIHKHLERP